MSSILFLNTNFLQSYFLPGKSGREITKKFPIWKPYAVIATEFFLPGKNGFSILADVIHFVLEYKFSSKLFSSWKKWSWNHKKVPHMKTICSNSNRIFSSWKKWVFYISWFHPFCSWIQIFFKVIFFLEKVIVKSQKSSPYENHMQ